MSYNTRRTGTRTGPQVNYHQAPQNAQQRQQPNRPAQQQNPGYNTTPSSFGQTGFSAQSGYSSVQQVKQPQQAQQQSQPQLPQVPPPAPPANPPPQPVQQQPAPPKVDLSAAAPPPPAEDPVPMSVEDKAEANGEGGEGVKKRPFWMKKGPAYKVSKRMKRRRQNARLRKVLTPKNALMILNELYQGIKFTVQEQINAIGQPVYTVYVDVEGKQHHAQAMSKTVAKQLACENALKALLLDKMGKLVHPTPAEPMDSTQDSTADDGVKSEGDDNMDGSSVSSVKSRKPLPEDDVPWGCLASFALHKLFLEWQSQGIQVPIVTPARAPLPLLKPPTNFLETAPSKPFSPYFVNRRKRSINKFVTDSPLPFPDNSYEKSTVDDSLLQGAGRSPLPMKKMPEDASKCNPVQLLNQLKPGSQYTEQRDGVPPNLTFTMTVVVDGQEFIGVAGNKRDAKRECARSALLKMGIINDI